MLKTEANKTKIKNKKGKQKKKKDKRRRRKDTRNKGLMPKRSVKTIGLIRAVIRLDRQ